MLRQNQCTQFGSNRFTRLVTIAVTHKQTFLSLSLTQLIYLARFGCASKERGFKIVYSCQQLMTGWSVERWLGFA